ncbi:Dabb family protein [Maribacter sp. 2210JD10-5]|uniref:Dabb family protein n=1 Tax=Maribacter sp. 2210JD10-5 TaxID=3386272 RepID=UPI0039BD11BC
MKKLATIVFLALSFTTYAQSNKDMKSFDSNFAHTVYFWLANPDSTADCEAFETSLQKFLDNSAYAKTKFIGKPPKASRDVVDGSFTYSLIVTFESAEAQQNYQDEAPHKLFIAESSKLWTKVIVYDSKGIN